MAREREICRVVGTTRVRGDRAPVAGRLRSFDDAEGLLTPEQAVAEALRCTAASPCRYCDVCQLLCPDLAITRHPETREIVIDLTWCKGCGLCAHYCPHGAIHMVVDE
ncbi:MAG TPA: 4Fe-4S binding protein [Polyangia bacterium]|nr:4Fe-4S binding protein [Polyangia bacterium]